MSFIHSLFILGSLAAAVPVLIHMSKSRNYQRVRIGTLRFLSSVVQERRRIKTIENWPLLLARIAILILLALLFARPFWPNSKPTSPQASETIILVDSSGSLAHSEAASRVAGTLKNIQKSLPPESTVTIAEFADVVHITENPKAIAGAPTNFNAAVDWTIEHLAHSEHTPEAIHLITDLQKSPLPTAATRLWPTGVRTEIHRIPQPTDYNIAIESVTLATPFKEEEIEIEALVKVFGSPSTQSSKKRSSATNARKPKDVLLTLSNGVEKRVAFPSQGGRVRFRWKLDELTELDGTISITSKDPWPSDDSRNFSFRMQEKKKVLLVDGDPGASIFLGEAYFLDKALLASGATHGQSPFTTTISYGLTTRNGLIDLDEYDVIALCNVPSLSLAEASALQEANAQGCSLMFILGDQTNESSFSPLQSSGLFPQLKTTTNARMAPVTSWDHTQPALESLPTASLRALLLRNAFISPPSSDWKALASFSNKNPFLLERANLATKQGSILILAHPVTREWGDFPLDNLFVPMMRELFASLSGYQETDSQIIAGTPGFQQKKKLGIYPAGNDKIELINADLTEMNPEVASLSAIRKSLGIPKSVPPADSAPEKKLPKMAEQAREIWPWFLLALLLLLVIENTLADRRFLTLNET